MMNLASHLKQMTLFADLTDAQRDQIAAACRRRVCRGRVQLFYQGDPGGSLYIVVRGGVKIYTDGDGGGKETTLTLCAPGEFFGDMALLTGGARTACAETIAEETELLILDQHSFEGLLRDCPGLTRELLRIVALRLVEANKQLTGRDTTTSLGRVCRLLLARTDAASGRLCPPMSQEEIANCVGVRRETVARNLARLEESGCLHRNRGNMLVTDRRRLEWISQTN